MGHLLRRKCSHSLLNLRILSSTSVPFTLTTVQVLNLALTHKKRITVWPLAQYCCPWLMIVAPGPGFWLWPLAYVCRSWLMIVAHGSWLFPLAHDCDYDYDWLWLWLLPMAHDCFPWRMIVIMIMIDYDYDCCPWLMIVSPGAWLWLWLWLIMIMIVARRAYVYKTHVVKCDRCLGFHPVGRFLRCSGC